MTEIESIVHRLNRSPAEPAVLATLVSVEGSSYRRPGARLLVQDTDGRCGSISGGCLEEDVLVRARRVASTGTTELAAYDTTTENDLVWGVGLGCHGVVHVLLEPLPPNPAWAATLASNLAARRSTRLAVVWKCAAPEVLGTRLDADPPEAFPANVSVFRESVAPPPALYLFGAGDDARPLVRLASLLGWQVTVADPRAAFASRERFPDAHAVITGSADGLVAKVNPEAGGLAVVMTHHYVHDLPLLTSLLPRPLRYLGLLGPRQRAERILDEIGKAGVHPASPGTLHAPVGLDLGGDHPEEVALSIVAEIQSVLAGRDARPLRQRAKPIHGEGRRK